LYLPDADEVQKPTRPASSGTIQVAVGTAVPDLRNVVVATYFSSPMFMPQIVERAGWHSGPVTGSRELAQWGLAPLAGA